MAERTKPDRFLIPCMLCFDSLVCHLPCCVRPCVRASCVDSIALRRLPLDVSRLLYSLPLLFFLM
jgi:hypothetical protein